MVSWPGMPDVETSVFRRAVVALNGGSGSNTLIGSDVDNVWDITGSNSGSLSSASIARYWAGCRVSMSIRMPPTLGAVLARMKVQS